MLLILFIDYSSNSKKIAEDEQYIIRHYVTASLFDDFNEKRIYKKQGIVEKYIGSFDGSDIYPHKRHEIHSFHIDESKNVFIGHYHSLLNAKDTVMSFPIVNLIIEFITRSIQQLTLFLTKPLKPLTIWIY